MEVYNKYQEAALVWLEQNPGKTLASCKAKEKVELLSLKTIALGDYLVRIRGIRHAMQQGKKYWDYRNLTEDEITWWTEHGMEWETPIMGNCSLYQQAALLWIEQNPDKTLVDCKQTEDVVLANQQIVRLGCYLSRIRGIYRAMQQGKKYQNYRNLTEKEITWWMEHGMEWETPIRIRDNGSLYQQAVLVWLAQNPEKTLSDCRVKTQVLLENGKLVHLGMYLARLRMIYRAMQQGKKYRDYKNLTDAEIEWWTQHGMTWDKQKKGRKKKERSFLDSKLTLSLKSLNIEEQVLKEKKKEGLTLWQEAALVWLNRNPNKTLADCRQKEDVVLANQQTVHLGYYLSRIRGIYRAMQKGKRYQNCCDLTEEEIAWWTELGMNWDKQKAGRKRKEVLTQWQEAALHWLHKNPDKTLSDCVFEENVTLSPKKSVPLGRYLIRIQKIYRAMQQGKRYSNYPDLTEEEIEWWTKHGMNFESSVEKSKDSTASQKTETPKKTANSHKINVKQYTQTAEYTGFHLNKQSIHKIIKKDLQKIVPDQWFVELYEEIMRAAAYRKIYGADILKLADTITRSYLLTPAEQKALYQALRKYLLFAKESYITKVSREPEESLKIDKIQKYGLDEFDIEESFFLELRREQNPILRKKNELLISYIIDWNEYSQEEREEVQKLQGFSDTDMQYIEEMRNRIDTLLEKVKMKRRK